MQRTLTSGPITKNLLLFAAPLMVGNLLQQCYNLADTWVVGRFLGADALAAVGSSYTLMVFLTSILLGLCMGSGAIFSICYGQDDMERLKSSLFTAFAFICVLTLLLNLAVYLLLEPIIRLLQVPPEVSPLMRDYLQIIFAGISATFLYNFFSNLLRAVGDSVTPLIFLAISSVLNIVLDLVFVLVVPWGVKGAAFATILSQFVAGLGLLVYTLLRFPALRIARRHIRYDRRILRDIASLSSLTCLQQSVMNFGILMIQGLVNSFGTAVMAAFAAAVKIDSFAYMPVQDFGNAFSTFTAQNFGAGNQARIRAGIRSCIGAVCIFCFGVSALVCLFARPLMGLFVAPSETEIIAIGVQYLWIEASCYVGIGLLFLLYGFFRAVRRPMFSVVLTAISLGTRVLLAYILSAVPAIGVVGIWMSVPIGWFLADLTGFWYYKTHRTQCLAPNA